MGDAQPRRAGKVTRDALRLLETGTSQSTIVGGFGAGERPSAVRLADIEVQGRASRCHETGFSTKARVVIAKRIAKNKLTAMP